MIAIQDREFCTIVIFKTEMMNAVPVENRYSISWPHGSTSDETAAKIRLRAIGTLNFTWTQITRLPWCASGPTLCPTYSSASSTPYRRAQARPRHEPCRDHLRGAVAKRRRARNPCPDPWLWIAGSWPAAESRSDGTGFFRNMPRRLSPQDRLPMLYTHPSLSNCLRSQPRLAFWAATLG